MEKAKVASKGLSQITKLVPPGGQMRAGAKSGPLEKGIFASRRKIQGAKNSGASGANLRGLGRGVFYYLSMA